MCLFKKLMAIEPVLSDLRKELEKISASTKANFLKKFAKIHNEWHMAEMNTGTGTFHGSPIGFLSFHHEVVAVYTTKYKADLSPGPMAKTSPPYKHKIDNALEATSFSSEIEGWHNLVHRNIKKYGANFANPTKNIYMDRFWQFHKFIDGRFENWLQSHSIKYEDVDHTQV